MGPQLAIIFIIARFRHNEEEKVKYCSNRSREARETLFTPDTAQ